jgi:hypothetical protein
MKSIAILFVSLLLLMSLGPVGAAENQQSSRSIGKLQMDTSIDLSKQLRQLDPQRYPIAIAPQNYAARANVYPLEGVANRYDQLFEIYDADVQLVADLDGDGYHHALRVLFDVDVSVGSATVYAKLYLSREGEPWTQYFTTDLFTLHGDDAEDAYEVESELLEGYVPGYYAVLIEIYSLDHAFMVASEVLDYQTLGRDLMIEDLNRDESYVGSSGDYYEEEFYYSESGGGGSIATLLLFFLIVQVVIAARGSLALSPLSPRNDSDYKNKYKTP